jgi:hypothetical protein
MFPFGSNVKIPDTLNKYVLTNRRQNYLVTDKMIEKKKKGEFCNVSVDSNDIGRNRAEFLPANRIILTKIDTSFSSNNHKLGHRTIDFVN